jgi:E3 ubiquitin-protein ligase SDIR1
MKTSEDELTCTICLEQVNRGELVRSLPCLHQVFPLALKSHHCLPKNLDFIQQLILSTVLLII